MKILIIDDHVLIREALVGVLRELVDNSAVIEARDWRRAQQALLNNPDIDLILLDLGLPDRSGFDVLRELRASHPATPVVVLSAREARSDIARSLELGAFGFIPKSTERPVMLGALRLIIAGGVYVPPEALDLAGTASAPVAAPSVPTPSPADLGLTDRQMDVLALLMLGKSNKAICRMLDLAEPTVKNHITGILKALRATNRTEAVIAAQAMGLQPASQGDRIPDR